LAAVAEKVRSGSGPGRDRGDARKALLATVTHLRKQYASRDGDDIVALSDISLDIFEGEFLSVVGPSGCGKSTLLHIMAGVLERTSGQVVLRGSPIDGPRREIGTVFQEPLLLPWRTVLDNVLLPIEVHRLPIEQFRPKALALLELTGLAAFANKYPQELSGGMQQRVSIARALVHDPAILLMDEPFGALDAMTREQMNMDLMKLWSSAGKTILLITHSISEAVLLGDRVVVMSPRPGRIAEVIDIELERPRNLDITATPEFGAYARRVRDHLFARPSSHAAEMFDGK
jgi:NitT/TauT family transport system ATP-binding protein